MLFLLFPFKKWRLNIFEQSKGFFHESRKVYWSDERLSICFCYCKIICNSVPDFISEGEFESRPFFFPPDTSISFTELSESILAPVDLGTFWYQLVSIMSAQPNDKEIWLKIKTEQNKTKSSKNMSQIHIPWQNQILKDNWPAGTCISYKITKQLCSVQNEEFYRKRLS